ncbi:hypothetical protein QYE76_051697 [Lolium multiflorum]|uniref:Uncharacterized protein n=1 Tax=Lolium multiflorum TaxID=4521 RepID=A0AAD8SSC1_LOLMU|nr:hypothetical protein QYE76_051697 [Lolium multiflorum]
MSGYNTWLFHGEDLEVPATDCSSDDEEYADSDQMDNMLLEGFGMYDSSTLGEDDDEEVGSEDDADLYFDVEAYNKLVLDGSKELFPGCNKLTKLQFLVKLMNIKNMYGVPNACFDDTLTLFKAAIPDGDSLPKNFHACKKYIKDVGLGYESIDACKHDCIMFRGEHSEATVCPVCNTSRWRSVNKGSDGKREYKVAHKKTQNKKKRKKTEDEECEDIYCHTVEATFKKRSVFFQLPYWKTLLIRNNLDIMHIEKNVFDNIVNTVLDVDKRSKDNLNARKDLQLMNIRCDWVKPNGFRTLEPFGIEQVNFNHVHSGDDVGSEPFVLASQVQQVYYVQDPVEEDWSAVICPTIRDFYDMEPAVNVHDSTVSLDSQHKRLERLNHQLHKMDLPSADMPIDDGKTKLYLLQNAKDRCLYYSQLEAARNYCTEEEEEEEEEEEDEDGKEYDAEFDDDKTGQGKYEEEQYAQEQYEEEEHAPAQSRTEEANQEIKGTKGKKKEGVRGPTEMKKFWEKHGPDNKVELVFNHLGQPCGVKTSKLANFIGSCVKGKEVSMGHDEWRKVPESEKDRLWTVVKGFFNIGDEHKDWVMKSASKKWRTFRAHLKDTYFDDELSLSQNIKNGCDERIPEMQWKKSCKYWKSVKFFRLSVKNKASRRSQDNAHHTAGSRSFAVVLEQEELKKKRPVSRAELYSIVHTNSKGQPVDTYSSTKIAAIKEELGKNPELISEAHHQGDIYSKIFPETRKSRMHGLGLMVGGKTSQILDQAIVALKDSKDENKELREMIRTMAESHKALVIRSQAMEEKIEGLILSQQQVSTQATTTFPASNDGEPSNTQEAGKRSTSQEVNHAVTNIQSLSLVKPKRAAVINAQEDKKEDQSVPAPALVLKVDKSAVTAALKVKEQDKETATETLEDDQRDSGDLKKRPRKKKLEDIPEGKKRQYMVHKVKLEKLKENSAASLKCKPHKENEIHAFKRGMEVSLRSPNSLQLVASATVSNVDDKETGPDYVEVLVNYVMKKSTMLPRPHGKIKKMSSAQATCILWPRIHMNVVTQSEIVHQQIWKGHDEERSRVDKDGVSVVVEKTKKLKRGSTDMSQNEVVEADGQKRRKLQNNLEE